VGGSPLRRRPVGAGFRAGVAAGVSADAVVGLWQFLTADGGDAGYRRDRLLN